MDEAPHHPECLDALVQRLVHHDFVSFLHQPDSLDQLFVFSSSPPESEVDGGIVFELLNLGGEPGTLSDDGMAKDGWVRIWYPSFRGSDQRRWGRRQTQESPCLPPLPSRCRYFGQMRSNRRHGVGVYIYTRFDEPSNEWKRSAYVGTWKCGYRHGHGAYITESGIILTSHHFAGSSLSNSISFFSRTPQDPLPTEDTLTSIFFPNGDEWRGTVYRSPHLQIQATLPFCQGAYYSFQHNLTLVGKWDGEYQESVVGSIHEGRSVLDNVGGEWLAILRQEDEETERITMEIEKENDGNVERIRFHHSDGDSNDENVIILTLHNFQEQFRQSTRNLPMRAMRRHGLFHTEFSLSFDPSSPSRFPLHHYDLSSSMILSMIRSKGCVSFETLSSLFAMWEASGSVRELCSSCDLLHVAVKQHRLDVFELLMMSFGANVNDKVVDCEGREISVLHYALEEVVSSNSIDSESDAIRFVEMLLSSPDLNIHFGVIHDQHWFPDELAIYREVATPIQFAFRSKLYSIVLSLYEKGANLMDLEQVEERPEGRGRIEREIIQRIKARVRALGEGWSFENHLLFPKCVRDIVWGVLLMSERIGYLPNEMVRLVMSFVPYYRAPYVYGPKSEMMEIETMLDD